ncbi:MAG: DNA-directed RNA polymerase subunit H [Candidatus Woesearchaeota archaeon]
MVKKSPKTKTSTEELKHSIIPKHEIAKGPEIKAVFEKYNITVNELPKILISDPGIRHLGAKPGDIIKITRISPTSGKSIYYRGVVSD